MRRKPKRQPDPTREEIEQRAAAIRKEWGQGNHSTKVDIPVEERVYEPRRHRLWVKR